MVASTSSARDVDGDRALAGGERLGEGRGDRIHVHPRAGHRGDDAVGTGRRIERDVGVDGIDVESGSRGSQRGRRIVLLEHDGAGDRLRVPRADLPERVLAVGVVREGLRVDDGAEVCAGDGDLAVRGRQHDRGGIEGGLHGVGRCTGRHPADRHAGDGHAGGDQDGGGDAQAEQQHARRGCRSRARGAASSAAARSEPTRGRARRASSSTAVSSSGWMPPPVSSLSAASAFVARSVTK